MPQYRLNPVNPNPYRRDLFIKGPDMEESGDGATSFIDLVDTPLTYGTPGQVPVVNLSGDGLIWADGGGGGVNQFLQLIDTPGSYAGAAGHLVRVNTAENALEFSEFTLPEIWEIDGGVADTIFYIPDNDLAVDAGNAGTVFNIP